MNETYHPLIALCYFPAQQRYKVLRNARPIHQQRRSVPPRRRKADLDTLTAVPHTHTAAAGSRLRPCLPAGVTSPSQASNDHDVRQAAQRIDLVKQPAGEAQRLPSFMQHFLFDQSTEPKVFLFPSLRAGITIRTVPSSSR